MRVHEALEELDARGIRVQRCARTPERYLSWIDAEFGGWWSSWAFASASYIAEDDEGPVACAAFDPRALRYPGPLMGEDVGVLGPFGVVPRARGKRVGSILLQGALFSLRERGYARALIPVADEDRSIAYIAERARIIERRRVEIAKRTYRTVVLASGNGTNTQTVIDAAQAGRLPLDLVRLVVNQANAYAIERAKSASVPVTTLLWDRTTVTRAQFDATVLDAVAAEKPDLVLLLGWMHVLPRSFLERFPHVLNIHPAFLPLDATLDTVTMPDGQALPAFRGARAVDDALAQGARWFGSSVHRVGAEIDRGEIMVRAPLRRYDEESRAALLERIHVIERRILVEAIERWICERHDDDR